MADVAQKDINKVLNGFFWPQNLEAGSYSTTHDDNDGDPLSGILTVGILPDGDTYVRTHGGSLRFRNGLGGGRFLKIRNALLILALAIKEEGRME